jgi:guanyl-specific ribonuclease Sa
MKTLSTTIILTALVETMAFSSLPYVAVRKPGFARPTLACRVVTEKTSSNDASIEKSAIQQTNAISKDSMNDAPGVSKAVSQATDGTNAIDTTDEKPNETKRLLQQVKDAGIAGVISYAAWEIGFWAVSIPVVMFGYYEFAGHWPDLSNTEDVAKLSAEAFAFVNFARFAVPLRIGLALSTTPWIQANIVDKFMKEKGQEDK